MLVITRRVGEGITLLDGQGRSVHVTLVRVDHAGGNSPRVRLGFEAPPDIQIVRDEIASPAAQDRGEVAA